MHRHYGCQDAVSSLFRSVQDLQRRVARAPAHIVRRSLSFSVFQPTASAPARNPRHHDIACAEQHTGTIPGSSRGFETSPACCAGHVVLPIKSRGQSSSPIIALKPAPQPEPRCDSTAHPPASLESTSLPCPCVCVSCLSPACSCHPRIRHGGCRAGFLARHSQAPEISRPGLARHDRMVDFSQYCY